MPAVHPPVEDITASTVIFAVPVAMIVAMVVTCPVGSSVVGITPSVVGITPSVISPIVSAPSIGGIPGIIVTSVPVSVISTIVGIPVGKSKSPAGISKTDTHPPVNGAPGIEIEICVIRIVIIPPIILIREAPQIG
jgi:hypothetical protein